MKTVRKRFVFLFITLLTLCATSLFELFVQKKQHIIGGGISRVFFFLFINIHIVTLLVLLYLIVRQSIKLFVERKKEKPGSIFRRNLLFAFTVFSVIPTTFVFFVAGNLITTSIDSWFEKNLGKGLEQGLALHQHQTADMRSSLLTQSKLLHSACSSIVASAETKKDLVEQLQNAVESHPGASVWLDKGKPLVGSIYDEIQVWRSYRKVNNRSMASLKKAFLHKLNASTGSGTLIDFYGSTYAVFKNASALAGNNGLTNWYLLVPHRYPPAVRYPLIDIQTSLTDYQHLLTFHDPIYWHYFLIFMLATMLILLLSVWCAFYLAQGISTPIQTLLSGLEKIRRGNLETYVRIDPTSDLKSLAVGVNEMTKALRTARTSLEQGYKEIFAILEHLKASVFVVNKYGRIITYNTASKKMIESFLQHERFKNKKFSQIDIELARTLLALRREMKNADLQQLSRELTLTRHEKTVTVMIHLTSMTTGIDDRHHSLLVVVEDLTDIVKMNKIKTWQQAAHQMAHEIKNPLTPIQLATQRLRRKYRKLNGEDAVIHECTDTILEQVNIIRNLVSHFSDYGKLPAQVLEPTDINEMIQQVTCLYEVSYPDIQFVHDLENMLPHIKLDKKKIKRVLINLLDNSVRALEGDNNKTESKITIKTRIRTGRNTIELLVTDTGPGIPFDVKDTLFLPHVSTNKKNMGLGLAIVHEHITQLGGGIKLVASRVGATFQIRLPFR